MDRGVEIGSIERPLTRRREIVIQRDSPRKSARNGGCALFARRRATAGERRMRSNLDTDRRSAEIGSLTNLMDLRAPDNVLYVLCTRYRQENKRC